MHSSSMRLFVAHTLFFTLGVVLFGVSPLGANPSHSVVLGEKFIVVGPSGMKKKKFKKSMAEVLERVTVLESAVVQLQQKLAAMEEVGTPLPQYVCSLSTSTKGPFLGKATTQTEAKALAMGACRKSSMIGCDSETIRCEKESP